VRSFLRSDEGHSVGGLLVLEAAKETAPAPGELGPSYFWMPQVGYGIRPQATIFCEAALFDFDHSPNFPDGFY
jgi:hypothetical protein